MKLLRTTSARRATNDTRTGTVLVLFAVLVFALLGIAALTVDIGFASLAQAQMQSAADTAALEGMRLRDYDVYRWRSNLFRRPHVSELVQQTMDDDLHPTDGVRASDGFHPSIEPDGSDALRLGAGPRIGLTGGIGAANASALIVIPDGTSSDAADRWVDDPHLQYNLSNAPGGDMVSGRYNPYASHAENEAYERDDFTPAVPVGFDTSERHNALGFLVRLRRTSGANPLDGIDQISSRGGTIPFLFGLGTSIHAAGPGYNPRRDGLAVRAVAIAAARAAISIGPPPLRADGTPVLDRRNEPILGAGYWHTNGTGTRARYAIAFSYAGFWQPVIAPTNCLNDAGAGGTGWDLTFDSTGTIRWNGTVVGQLMLGGGCIGELVPNDLTAGPGAIPPAEVQQIFAEILALVASSPGFGYFPVYRDISAPAGGSSQRVIGFGYGRISSPAPNALRYTLDFDTRDDGPRTIVAFDNASASLTCTQLPSGLSRAEWDQVFSSVIQFAYPAGVVSGRWQDVRVGTVLAPALTR